jgi:hypothetical protein
MTDKTKRARMMLSLPHPDKAWIEEQAEANCTSLNSEVIRAIRERRQREAAEQRAQ